MLSFAKKATSTKPEIQTETKIKPEMTLDEATQYLKKIGEWQTVSRMDLKSIIGWAEFLKNKGITN